MELIQINNMNDLKIAFEEYEIHHLVKQDVCKRIMDWLLSGGKLEDNYIKQQYKYLERYINTTNEKKKCN